MSATAAGIQLARRRAPRFVRLHRLAGLIVKESRQIVRDPSNVLIAFVLPAILLLLIGFGVSLDATRLAVGVVLESGSPDAHALASAFVNSRHFEVRLGHDRREFVPELAAGHIRGLVVIPADFPERLRRPGDDAAIQVIVDGSEPNTAAFVQNYARALWLNWLHQRALEHGARPPPGATLEPRHWFNPELVSRNNLVPASIAIIMTSIGTLLTAMVVAREWERGTMEALMATPVAVGEIVAGKVLPYFLLGLAAMLVCVVTAIGLFDVPLRGSPFALFAVASAFLMPALGQGLLISTVAKNQFVAAQAAILSGFLPAVLLSGFVFEISSMPMWLQWLTKVIHAKYLVSSLQTIFLAGDIWSLIVPDILGMLGIGTFFLLLIARKTPTRLG
jgi:ABC-2 type transport system permease protein